MEAINNIGRLVDVGVSDMSSSLTAHFEVLKKYAHMLMMMRKRKHNYTSKRKVLVVNPTSLSLPDRMAPPPRPQRGASSAN